MFKGKQDGSVFHGLSQDSEVSRCPCNSWPSGLSENAKLLRTEAFSGQSQNDCGEGRTISLCFLKNEGLWCRVSREVDK